MVRWHHQLNGLEFEQALGNGKGQGSLACCRPWGRKGSDITEQLLSLSKKRITVFLGIEFAPHSSTPAWKIPWREEPGRLQSMGLLRVGHN